MTRPADRNQRLRARSAGVLAAAASLALAACGSGSETGPGGVSDGEARALDEAAEKLDRQQLPDSAIPPVDLPMAQQAPTGSAADSTGPPAVPKTDTPDDDTPSEVTGDSDQ